MAKSITEKMKDLRESFGNKCNICGSKNNLQFAHIKVTSVLGNGRGMKKRYYDIVKNRDSYVLLCEKCHYKFDRKNHMWKNKNTNREYKYSFERFKNEFRL